MISRERKHDIADAEKIIYKLQALDNFYEPALFQKIISEILPEYQPAIGRTLSANSMVG